MKYLKYLIRHREEISIRYDKSTKSIWCYLNPKDRPKFSMNMLQELLDAQHALIDYHKYSSVKEEYPVKFWIYASMVDGIFNYGGDLEYILQLIAKGDRDTIYDYAKICIDILYLNSINFNLPIITFSLVEGDALAGAFELVLSTNVSIVEESAHLGLPEVKFNMFPGMGAYTFLTRKHTLQLADTIIKNGSIFTASKLHQMGVIDHIVEEKKAYKKINELLAYYERYFNAYLAMNRARLRSKELLYDELLDIVKIWVDTALKIDKRDIKFIEKIISLQESKVSKRVLKRAYHDRRVINESNFPLIDSKNNKIEFDRRRGYDRRMVS